MAVARGCATRSCWRAPRPARGTSPPNGEPDLPALTAALGYGLARNHPFVDGNKRTAFVAVEVFPGLNDLDLAAGDADCVLTMLRLAAGDLPGEGFAAWLRDNTAPRA